MLWLCVISQTVRVKDAARLVAALEKLGTPVYLSGMGRGLLVRFEQEAWVLLPAHVCVRAYVVDGDLLSGACFDQGKEHHLQMRHKRGAALAKADFILLCGKGSCGYRFCKDSPAPGLFYVLRCPC